MEESAVKNTKKTPKSKKSVWVIVLSVVIGALLIAGAVTAFVLNYNQYAPDNVRVLDDGQNVYLAADMNDNYLYYRFTFTRDEEQIVIDSQNNLLSIDQMLEEGIEIGATYQITVCYLDENQGNNSKNSEALEWTAYRYLASPSLSYNAQDDQIEWQAIEEADYYIVYSNGLEPITTTNCYLDLQTISGGNRTFYVVAYSNNEHLKTSPASNQLSREVIHYYQPFVSVEFNNNDKLLTIQGREELSSFYVYLNDERHICTTFDLRQENDVYIYEIDLFLLYQDGQTIGASPMTINEFYVYNGDITYASI